MIKPKQVRRFIDDDYYSDNCFLIEGANVWDGYWNCRDLKSGFTVVLWGVFLEQHSVIVNKYKRKIYL